MEILYDGQKLARLLEPHIVYRSEEESLTLLAYQVRGYRSSARQDAFWRPFQLRKIDHISIVGELFEPRIDAGYFKVAAMVKGRALLRVQEAGEYLYLNTAIYGPPAPSRKDEVPGAVTVPDGTEKKVFGIPSQSQGNGSALELQTNRGP